MSMPSRVALTPNVLALAGVVGDLGGVQQRLGRDAAAVQAGAADLVLLDQRDPLAELGGAQRAGVAAAAATEDDDVVAARQPLIKLSLSLWSSPVPAGTWLRAEPRPRRRTAGAPATSLRHLHERADRGAGAALRGVAVGLALVERRARRCRGGPSGTPSGTNSCRNRPATSMPPYRSPACSRCRRRSESRPLRSSSGSGIGQACSPARPAASTTPARTASSLAITPAIAGPERDELRTGERGDVDEQVGRVLADRTSASARTRRPSASVLSTSTVLPP